MKAITINELKKFLESIKSEFDIRVPIKLHDTTRTLGKLEDGALDLSGGVIPLKITSIFFPQFEKMFTIEKEGTIRMEKSLNKPLLVIGFTAQDTECLEFIDKFFSENFRDDVYFGKRENAIIVAISGKCGKDGDFLKIAGGKCDMELIFDGEKYIAAAYSQKGKELVSKITCSSEIDSIEELQNKSEALPKDDLEILKKASELIKNELVPDEFWNEISNSCIACTSCNYSCPTCTCFEVYDRGLDGNIERYRMWDSCQLDGFMREASGHNPLGTEMSRTRRRIHHKLAADLEKWGHITCFLCGRCDEACPTNIGIKSVTKEIVKRYGQDN